MHPNSRPQHRVLLVSEDGFARRGMACLIDRGGSFAICAEAPSSAAAMEQLAAHRPDMLVLDLSLRDGLGVQLVRQIKAEYPDTRIAVLTMHEDVFYAGQVLAAGARMYISKRGDPQEFLRGLQQVAAGEMYVSAEIAQQLLYHATGSASGKRVSLVSALTERELQVFELIGQGLNTKRIASQIGISPHTVETYRERIRAKINAENGADLTFRAIAWTLLNS